MFVFFPNSSERDQSGEASYLIPGPTPSLHPGHLTRTGPSEEPHSSPTVVHPTPCLPRIAIILGVLVWRLNPYLPLESRTLVSVRRRPDSSSLNPKRRVPTRRSDSRNRSEGETRMNTDDSNDERHHSSFKIRSGLRLSVGSLSVGRFPHFQLVPSVDITRE